MSKLLRILYFGDVVGLPGRTLFQKWARKLKEQYRADAVLVNGENSTDRGRGISAKIANAFFHNGADAISTGNHVWAKKEVYGFLDECTRITRPANYPSSCPGRGYAIFEVAGHTVALLNLQGRVFMHDDLDCPFKTADSILPFLKEKTKTILVDFHAEATSEKRGMGFYLDGRVSAVVGTHTHVQTSDNIILPKGTAYISDLGYSGALNSMLGMKKDIILRKFITQMPQRFEVEHSGPMVTNGVCIEIDTETGKGISIERFSVIDEDISASILQSSMNNRT